MSKKPGFKELYTDIMEMITESKAAPNDVLITAIGVIRFCCLNGLELGIPKETTVQIIKQCFDSLVDEIEGFDNGQ